MNLHKLEQKRAAWMTLKARFFHPCDRSEIAIQAKEIRIEIQSNNERLNILGNG